MRRAVIALLLALTPRRWRDSIAGDFEESAAGGIATLVHALPAIARLWIEELSIARATPRRRFSMTTAGFQARQAVRALLKRPAYSLVVIATLAIGIGANAAVFGLANWLLLRPMTAVHDVSQLATIRLGKGGGVFVMSHPEMEMVRSQVPGIQAIAGSMEADLNASLDGGDAYRVDAGIVSANYFEVLGVRLLAGQAFSATTPGIVVSHAFWKSRLGSSYAAVGRTLMVNGKPQPVLGVAPAGFTGTSRTSAVDIWVPTTLRATLFPGYRRDPLTTMGSGMYIELVARLAPGTTVADITPALGTIPAAIAKTHPRPQRFTGASFTADEGLTSRAFERERLARVFSLLTGMVAMLLLLACANVGNVMLAAGTSRRAEFATRQALGASRAQIVRSVFLESLLLALCGGAVALLIASLVSTMLRGTIVLPFIPALGEITLDSYVFVFALAASTLSAVVAGLLPALSATRFDLVSTLKASGRSVTAGTRARKVLTMAQVAVSLTLLVGAVLLARSVDGRRRVDLGFDPSPLLTFSVDPGLHTDDAARRSAFYDRLLARVAATPGVESVAASWDRPFGQIANDGSVTAIGGRTAEPADADVALVSPDYFRTMGIPVLAGREFTRAEQAASGFDPSDVAILSLSLARQLFGSADAAVGKAVMYGDERTVIVGVAGDARLRKAFEPPPHVIYKPVGRSQSFASLLVRSAIPPAALAGAMRDAAREADPTVPVYDVLTVRGAVDRQMSEEILVGRLAMAFAVIATLLAGVGLYGVLAQSVTDRRVEIGIRAALGAAPARVLRVVTSEAFLMTAFGGGAGIALSLWLTRFLESRLFGVARFDALTFGVAAAIIIVMAMAAAIVPALRAARVDPVTALRN